MATIDMRNSDESVTGEEVAFVGLVVGGPTLFVWEAAGTQGNQVRLYGSGITSSGGVPTGGTVNEIRIDIGSFDPIKDVIITGLSVPIVDLLASDDLFWETVLQNDDTIHAFYGGPSGDSSTTFGDGKVFVGSVGTTASNDTLDATGTPGGVEMNGDYRAVNGATLTAGDDRLLCEGADGDVDAVGDVRDVFAHVGDAVVTGGDDVIDVLSGSDFINLIGDVLQVVPSTSAGHDILVTGGDDTIISHGGGGNLNGDVYAIVEGGGGASTVAGGSDDITGSDSNERIAGDVYVQNSGFVDGGDDFIEGGGGNDNIAGDVLSPDGGTFTGGDDVIDGGLGNDTIDGQTGGDTAQFLSNDIGVRVVLDIGGVDGFAEGQGSDVLRDIENVITSDQDDTVTGNNERNVVLAFDGNDSLSGLGGADTLYGWNDDDTLRGGEGADQLYGGDGDDVLTGGGGDDTLEGEGGIDRIDFSAYGSGVTGDLLSGLFTAVSTDAASGIENVTGSRYADDLGGDGLGNDIRGAGGADTVHAGNGTDTLTGGDGNDLLNGQNNNDVIAGSVGDDTIDGGAGADWADFTAAANAVVVDLSLVGTQDTGEGLDSLLSIERLIGSVHADALTGSASGNVIKGLGGLDTMAGGTGADTFDFDAITDASSSSVATDTVTDFVQGSDLIDLRTIDAMSGTGGNQAFTHIGEGEFTAEGQVRAFVNNGVTTVVQVNVTGAAGSDMTLRLSGAFTLADPDFLL